ncbi:hypothetical protein K439DRAFT_1618476 [Ramaria rubella]|nr:hypothetical protein K439DRAFT_1618476 [Ramaria rubella]
MVLVLAYVFLVGLVCTVLICMCNPSGDFRFDEYLTNFVSEGDVLNNKDANLNWAKYDKSTFTDVRSDLVVISNIPLTLPATVVLDARGFRLLSEIFELEVLNFIFDSETDVFGGARGGSSCRLDFDAGDSGSSLRGDGDFGVDGGAMDLWGLLHSRKERVTLVFGFGAFEPLHGIGGTLLKLHKNCQQSYQWHLHDMLTRASVGCRPESKARNTGAEKVT